jgi:replicative DNA helicase
MPILWVKELKMNFFDNEIERAVLSCMIMNNEIIPNITSEISEVDFYSQANKDVFQTIKKFYGEGNDINILSLTSYHKEYRELIMTLTDNIPSSANWEFYTNKIKSYSSLRSLYLAIEEARGANEFTVYEKVHSLQASLSLINESQGAKDIVSVGECVIPVVEQLEQRIQNKSPFSGLDVGIDNLNDILDGLQNEYTLLGARASIGKSALAMNMARHIASKGKKVAYFSLEMSAESLTRRLISDIGGVNSRVFKSGLLTERDMQKINEANEKIHDMPLYILDKTRGRFDKIVAQCRYLVRSLGVEVIFIDHASLIKYSNTSLQRHEQYSQISNEIQSLQRELNVPIVLVAQLTRGAEGEMPKVSDLRESGAFEQDADCVILLHRSREVDKSNNSIPTLAYVAKNRNGACGYARLLFQPFYTRFVSISENEFQALVDNRKEAPKLL